MPLFAVVLAALTTVTGCARIKEHFSGPKTDFNAAAALSYAQAQVKFGPRVPGTPAHEQAGDWIIQQMKERGDSVIVQSWTQMTAKGEKLPMRNILARINPSATQRVLYLTHWDTRPTADDDPNLGKTRVSGTMRVTPIAAERDDEARVMTTVLRYEDGGEVLERPWVLHWHTQDGFRALAEAAGLVVQDVLDPDGRPAAPDADAVAFVLRRPAPD